MQKFFLPMIPPTVTDQEHKISVCRGKPVIYQPQELKQAKTKFMAALANHSPPEPYDGPVGLMVKWLFPITGDHKDGEWKTTRPDTDNLQKLFKDCMTKTGFWKDDAQVCMEHIEKFYSETTGVYVEIYSGEVMTQ